MGVTEILLLLAAFVDAPPHARHLPTAAVDHVVVMEVREGMCLTCADHRSTIIRSGSWVREERTYPDRTETRYSDFGSGTSLLVARDPQGTVLMLRVERSIREGSWQRLRRQPAGRRDSALGESCEIWAVSGDYYSLESCETADGIVLWTRNPRYPNLGSSRSLSVERRPVGPEEVRPPADLFDVAPWPQRAADPSDGVGYEVVLTSDTRGTLRTEVWRRQGSLVSGWGEGRHDEGTSFWAADGVSRFSYRVDAQGRAFELTVQRSDYGLRLVRGDRWERVSGRRPVRLLGERCTWQDETSIRSTDIHYQCRTADGVPLILEYDWHWDDTTDIYRARSLVRRPLTPADFSPPPEAIRWSTWGVDPSRRSP